MEAIGGETGDRHSNPLRDLCELLPSDAGRRQTPLHYSRRGYNI